jgi:hypothetical protein
MCTKLKFRFVFPVQAGVQSIVIPAHDGICHSPGNPEIAFIPATEVMDACLRGYDKQKVYFFKSRLN